MFDLAGSSLGCNDATADRRGMKAFCNLGVVEWPDERANGVMRRIRGAWEFNAAFGEPST